MAFIEIKPEMLTRNKEIDAHHKHLVEQFNFFLGGFRRGRHPEETGRFLDTLIDFSTYHFSAEEQWMRDLRYPGTAARVKEHKDFVWRISEIQKDFGAGRSGVSLEVIVFLTCWLKEHLHRPGARVSRFSRRSVVSSRAI